MKSHKALSLTNKVMFILKILFCDREKKKKVKRGREMGNITQQIGLGRTQTHAAAAFGTWARARGAPR